PPMDRGVWRARVWPLHSRGGGCGPGRGCRAGGSAGRAPRPRRPWPKGGLVVSPPSCWGVFRERTHSPGRESDDTEILRLTGKMLEARGFEGSVKSPEDILDSGDPPPPG